MFNEQFVILLCMCVSVTKERQIWDERWVWYGAGAGFSDEETGMRDKDERWAWYGAGLRVAVADGVIWCWVAAARFDDDGETEMRDRYERWETEERESKMRDRTEERESNKILLFFYNTCYSAILCLELHCSSIAKKFAILLFSILQCRWF